YLSGIIRPALATLRKSLFTHSVLHASRPFHTGQRCLVPLPPLPEEGGQVRHGFIPEEFFQFLYPKTGVTVKKYG
uniref:ATP synthase subunit b n=1 Tax=Terrapene triunguis TaxID=2587831 RepID=A0A674JUZ9_9SAUR